jgi:hypothetical protein
MGRRKIGARGGSVNELKQKREALSDVRFDKIVIQR